MKAINIATIVEDSTHFAQPNLRNAHCMHCTQGRLKGGANRAIARVPTFWGAHELFEKFFVTIYIKKIFLTVFFLYIINSN